MARGRPRKNADGALLKSAELIGWALGGLEREIVETKNRLSALTTQATALRKRIGTRAVAAVEAGAARASARKRRNLSPEARKRISDRMKKRWAEYRKTKGKGKSK
jgi:hypothetical protein